METNISYDGIGGYLLSVKSEHFLKSIKASNERTSNFPHNKSSYGGEMVLSTERRNIIKISTTFVSLTMLRFIRCAYTEFVRNFLYVLAVQTKTIYNDARCNA